MLVPDLKRIWIEYLQNRIGSRLKKIRLRTPLVCIITNMVAIAIVESQGFFQGGRRNGEI